MAYSDFSTVGVESTFGLRSRRGELFPDLQPVAVPQWLRDILKRYLRYPIATEKSRNELIVMPVLIACAELSEEEVTIHSGTRMDVEQSQGLWGECDFVLARAPLLPELRAPLITVVEAKQGSIESGLGQCAAQMVGARLFNERAGRALLTSFGCVTNGEVWQLLRLAGSDLTIDSTRYHLIDLGRLLAAFQAALSQATLAPAAPAAAV